MNYKISSIPTEVKNYLQKFLPQIKVEKLYSANFAFNTIIIFILFVTGLHLIYLYGQHPVIMSEEKFLDRIFKKKPYSPILEKLSQSQYVFINVGTKDHNKQALTQMINYLGAINRTGLIQKDLTKNALFNIPWIVRTFIQSKICPYNLTNKLYFFNIQKQVPASIKYIKVSQPNSQIVLVSPFSFSKEIKKQNFKDAGQFPNFDLKSVLNKQAKIPLTQLSKFQQYYKIRTKQVFFDIDSRWKSIQQSYLKDHYSPYGDLSQSTQKILEELCIDNKLARGRKITIRNKKQLQNFGISLQRGGAKWKHQKYMLNFLLQTQKKECDIVFIDTKSKYMIQRIGNYLSAEEIARRHRQRELQELKQEKALANKNNMKSNKNKKDKHKKSLQKRVDLKDAKKLIRKKENRLLKQQNSKKAKLQLKIKAKKLSLNKSEKEMIQNKNRKNKNQRKQINIKLK